MRRHDFAALYADLMQFFDMGATVGAIFAHVDDSRGVGRDAAGAAVFARCLHAFHDGAGGPVVALLALALEVVALHSIVAQCIGAGSMLAAGRLCTRRGACALANCGQYKLVLLIVRAFDQYDDASF